MKKNSSLWLALALVLSLLLSGCGQTSAGTPPVSEPAAGTEEPSEKGDEASDKSDETSDENAAAEDTPAENTPAENTTAGQESKPADTESTTKASNETSPSQEVVPAKPKTSKTSPEAPAPTSAPKTATEPAPTAESVPTAEPAPTTESVPTAEPAPTTESAPTESTPASETTSESTSASKPEETSASNTTLSGTTLTLRFGGGEEFTINLYDNDTADKIAEYVGTASWNLPIYHFDDYDGWESFQYYDIPSRYDIPDGSQSVTSEKAGAVYYSHPNRIILFYQDADISTEYTPIGYIDFSQSLMDAVENNPVVEGWGNKMVFVQP